MIKKLKTKFVCLAMSSLIVLLSLIIGGMNIINYNSIINEADETLLILSQNQGTFPEFKDNVMGGPFPSHMSPETPYESRFFSVLISSNGNVIQTDTRKIASINESKATEYAKNALKENNIYGFEDKYRYIKSTENNDIRIIFLDCGRILDSFYVFLYASIAMASVGLIITFLIILFFSGKIIRPVSESYEKQKRFITDAGHEIKTPLTIINANVDLLEMDIPGNDCLSDIKQQTERLTALTNDLVFLARMEESADNIRKVEIPISDIIYETVVSFKAPIQTQGKELIFNIQPMLSVNGNHNSIKMLVSILMDNAIKYSPKGGKIAVSFKKQNKHLILNIYNDSEYTVINENLSHIFDRFYRTDNSRNSQTGGYGIGLSIAKAIVDSHSGKISGWTDDGHSFNITVTLPL